MFLCFLLYENFTARVRLGLIKRDRFSAIDTNINQLFISGFVLKRKINMESMLGAQWPIVSFWVKWKWLSLAAENLVALRLFKKKSFLWNQGILWPSLVRCGSLWFALIRLFIVNFNLRPLYPDTDTCWSAGYRIHCWDSSETISDICENDWATHKPYVSLQHTND